MKVLVALLLCCSFALASKKSIDPSACKTFYTVVQRDLLGNLTQGAPKEQLKWISEDLQRKYPDICYAPPAPTVKTVLYISVERATYNGTRNAPSSSHTNGSITDNNGNSATYNGDTTSSHQVPYSVDYGKFMLTVESLGENSQVTVKRRFMQDGLYNTMYGIPLGGRGHHPVKALIEDAVKWMASGGLNDPLQSSQ